MNDALRKLTPSEIDELRKNGCSADNWDDLSVSSKFEPSRIVRSRFQGKIEIGQSGKTIDAKDGIARNTGIYDAQLSNVKVGANCYISKVGGWLSNLEIGPGTIIENVGSIGCTGKSTFGNGHEIDVLNESGGRELALTCETSAQLAYLNTLYRDRAGVIGQINKMVIDYRKKVESATMSIGANVYIGGAEEISDVLIGPYTSISGAKRLINGSIESSEAAPTVIGPDIIAENFIIMQGASVQDGAMLSGTLVGEGTKIGKQFSAENSVFFANCEGFHSEACSLFAGPYTVTHHRSTLLIAGLFSFYNAGSATNQSNHMYKLGPVHQGILERGCKTGSSSYLLWPSRVGAFTAVMGKHYANFDTRDFPFSYIDEHNGKSMLIPGMNFFTVGTVRDGQKWPARDRRKNSNKLDQIIFDVLSPYTVQKMLRGQQIMDDLYSKTEKGQAMVTYQGINIKRLLLKTCRRYYQMALDIYFGETLLRRIEKSDKALALTELGQSAPNGIDQLEEWIDVAGLLCAQSRMDDLCAAIEQGKINSIPAVNAGFKAIKENYANDEWNWFLLLYEQLNGKALAESTKEDIVALLEKWKTAYQKYLNLVANDAKKEFEGQVQTGYGIDGNQAADFAAVRGRYETNSFIVQLGDLLSAIGQRYETALSRIQAND